MLYLYCTKGENLWLTHNGVKSKTELAGYLLNGKVIGEFICDRIDEFFVYENGAVQYWNFYELEKSCLTYDEISNYIGKKRKGYAWHISDLHIYNEPKELSEFKMGCKGCKERDTYHCKFHCYGERPITRPPQSYIHVKELTND